jgi:hypothetical protein
MMQLLFKSAVSNLRGQTERGGWGGVGGKKKRTEANINEQIQTFCWSALIFRLSRTNRRARLLSPAYILLLRRDEFHNHT